MITSVHIPTNYQKQRNKTPVSVRIFDRPTQLVLKEGKKTLLGCGGNLPLKNQTPTADISIPSP